jgi:hypothetical protein
MLLLGTVAISSAVFLILELGQPFDGMVQISSAPVGGALAQLGRQFYPPDQIAPEPAAPGATGNGL